MTSGGDSCGHGDSRLALSPELYSCLGLNDDDVFVHFLKLQSSLLSVVSAVGSVNTFKVEGSSKSRSCC